MKTIAQLLDEEQDLRMKLLKVRNQLDNEIERELKELYEMMAGIKK